MTPRRLSPILLALSIALAALLPAGASAGAMGAPTPAVPTISVDPDRAWQRIEGLGASITDSSAHLQRQRGRRAVLVHAAGGRGGDVRAARVTSVTVGERSSARDVVPGMFSLAIDDLIPLTVSEQLDAMLSGWLDRHAPDYDRSEDGAAGAVVTVADAEVEEVEAFCASWGLTTRRTWRRKGRWTVLVVEGPAAPVRGFTAITAMYRR